METLKQSVINSLDRLGCHYSLDGDGDVLMLVGQPNGEVHAYHIIFPECGNLIQLLHIYLPVPPSRTADVARVMADLNAKYRFGTLGLRGELAHADLNLLCEHVSDIESHILAHLFLFMDTVRKTSESVRQAVLRKRARPSRFERDIADALHSAESAAS